MMIAGIRSSCAGGQDKPQLDHSLQTKRKYRVCHSQVIVKMMIQQGARDGGVPLIYGRNER